MRAIGRDEVDHRHRVLDVLGEVGPADIGLQEGVVGLGEELAAELVQRRDTHIAGPGHVQRGQVKRQADQVVAQRFGQEFVDLVADLARHAAQDGPGRRIGISADLREGNRVEEGFDQASLLEACSRGRAIQPDNGLQHVDVLVQHRVAEAVHDLREFLHDHRVDVDRVREHEGIDLRGNGAHELFEHQVLVDLFGGKAGGLEQTLAIPCQNGVSGGQLGDRHQKPGVDEGQVARGLHKGLDRVHLVVVLAVEDGVDRGQRGVFVAAAIADDEVRVQQLVVIGQHHAGQGVGCNRVSGHAVCIRRAGDHRCGGVAVVIHHAGGGAVGDVVQEGAAGRDGKRGQNRGGQVAFNGAAGGHQQRQAVGAPGEFAVKVGHQRRHTQHVQVGQLDAQHRAGLCLDVGPCRRSAGSAFQHVAGGNRLAAYHDVFAQEDLVRLVRGIDLVQVDPGGGGVVVLADVIGGAEDAVRARLVGGAGQRHEVGGRAFDIQRIIGKQRDIDGAGIALGG